MLCRDIMFILLKLSANVGEATDHKLCCVFYFYLFNVVDHTREILGLLSSLIGGMTNGIPSEYSSRELRSLSLFISLSMSVCLSVSVYVCLPVLLVPSLHRLF